MNSKISVIIPIYNAEKYLLPTLDSIRFQSYENLEIICVLDCPTDNSEKIVNEIQKEDKRVKIIKNSQNMGPAETRNNGVKNASGEYIHFCDSDDLLSPDFYEIMEKTANENDAELAVSSAFHEKEPKCSVWFQKSEVFTGIDKIIKTKVLIQGWLWRYLIKKSFWDKYNFSFPNFTIMEDTSVVIPMVYYAEKVVTCPSAVYFYKNRENSILNKKERSEKQQKFFEENLQNARKMKRNFIKTHGIKQQNKLYNRLVSLKARRTKCANDSIEYGKFDEKISVIIPIYNAEKYLLQTLDSVCFQTYKNLEIICVLDCPTDNSAKITEEIAKDDSRIKLIKHTKNMGLPAARNSGVENSTGKYIHFCDSDDLLSPDFYETMIYAAINNDADVSVCSVFYEKKQWRSIWFQKSEVLSAKTEKIEKTEVVFASWAWRYLIRKGFWDENKFSFPDLVPLEDKPVMIPMIYYANKVAICPSAVYFYKNRENSILNKKYDLVREKKRSENRQKARKIFKDFMRKHKIKRPNKLQYFVKKIFA